jgi:putative Mg2+ transporter-C (MgtC) family protein
MMPDAKIILEHLFTALAAGALIGLERSYHGRPAGFRTHTLVCVASSALMMITVYQSWWFPESQSQNVSLDPTRMAQGIMTGIGFLGAGVVVKEGLTIRGLTTAASIWMTAAVGILAGTGLYLPLALVTLITLGTLSVFRWIEVKMPVQSYSRLEVKFPREAHLSEEEVREFVSTRGFSIGSLDYRYRADPGLLEYRMVIRTIDPANVRRLSKDLCDMPISEFLLSPMGD